MVDASLAFTPITVFLVALLAAAILYRWGRALAPPPTPVGHKMEMYTGGEAPKAQEVRPSYGFFHVALFYTVLHVAALILVTAPGGVSGFLVAVYFGAIALAVAALSWR